MKGGGGTCRGGVSTGQFPPKVPASVGAGQALPPDWSREGCRFLPPGPHGASARSPHPAVALPPSYFTPAFLSVSPQADSSGPQEEPSHSAARPPPGAQPWGRTLMCVPFREAVCRLWGGALELLLLLMGPHEAAVS